MSHMIIVLVMKICICAFSSNSTVHSCELFLKSERNATLTFIVMIICTETFHEPLEQALFIKNHVAQ